MKLKRYKCPQCGKIKRAFKAPLCRGNRNPQHAHFHLYSYRMREIIYERYSSS